MTGWATLAPVRHVSHTKSLEVSHRQGHDGLLDVEPVLSDVINGASRPAGYLVGDLTAPIYGHWVRINGIVSACHALGVRSPTGDGQGLFDFSSLVEGAILVGVGGDPVATVDDVGIVVAALGIVYDPKFLAVGCAVGLPRFAAGL